MTSQTAQTIGETLTAPAVAAVEVRAKAISRILFVDNLRLFLTALVVIHHVMCIYSGSGSWYYQEGRQDFATSALGTWMLAVDQAFFMGLFMFVAAYFVPGAVDRKGIGRFVKDRLIRLGIPMVIYCWMVRPIWIYIDQVTRQGMSMTFTTWYSLYFTRFFGVVGSGPLWFVEALLLFSIGYAIWRLATRSRQGRPNIEIPFPRNTTLVLSALLLGIVTIVVRLWSPVDRWFEPLNFDFSHFPQYIILFVAGLIAYRNNWLANLPDQTGRQWLKASILLALFFWPMALLGGATENVTPFKGGLHWQAAVYAIWEAYICLGLSISLIYLFRKYANRQSKISTELSRSAYAVYILHEPVITFMALAAAGLMIYPLAKFALATLVAIPLCFALAGLVRRLPYIEKVL